MDTEKKVNLFHVYKYEVSLVYKYRISPVYTNIRQVQNATAAPISIEMQHNRNYKTRL